MGVSKTIIEHLVIWGCYHGPGCRNESSLCIEVLCQVIDVILLLDDFCMEVYHYMCIQMLGNMYNTGWHRYQIHHALQHHSCCLHCQLLLLNIFESGYYYFTSFFLWRGRRKMNILTGGKFVGIIKSGDPGVCMVKSHQIHKWVSFTWLLANSVNVSSCHWYLLKLDRLLYWEYSTIYHEFDECYFLYSQLQLWYSSTTPKNTCSKQMRIQLRTLIVLSWG